MDRPTLTLIISFGNDEEDTDVQEAAEEIVYAARGQFAALPRVEKAELVIPPRVEPKVIDLS